MAGVSDACSPPLVHPCPPLRATPWPRLEVHPWPLLDSTVTEEGLSEYSRRAVTGVPPDASGTVSGDQAAE